MKNIIFVKSTTHIYCFIFVNIRCYISYLQGKHILLCLILDLMLLLSNWNVVYNNYLSDLLCKLCQFRDEDQDTSFGMTGLLLQSLFLQCVHRQAEREPKPFQDWVPCSGGPVTISLFLDKKEINSLSYADDLALIASLYLLFYILYLNDIKYICIKILF